MEKYFSCSFPEDAAVAGLSMEICHFVIQVAKCWLTLLKIYAQRITNFLITYWSATQITKSWNVEFYFFSCLASVLQAFLHFQTNKSVILFLASELEWMTMQIYPPGGDYQKCQLVKFINERWCEERTKSPSFDQFWTGKCCDIGIREAQAKLRTKAEEKKVWCCIQKQILFAVQKWGNKDFEVLKLALQVEVGLKLLGK